MQESGNKPIFLITIHMQESKKIWLSSPVRQKFCLPDIFLWLKWHLARLL